MIGPQIISKRDITLFAIAVVGGRLKVVEGLPK